MVREAEASEVVRWLEASKVVWEEEADHQRESMAGLHHPRGDEEAREAEVDHRGL